MLNLSIEAFLLGISTGAYCFSQCGLVFIPFALSENGTNIRTNNQIVLEFLFGRFAAYSLAGLIVGFLGQTFNNKYSFFENDSGLRIIIGSSYIILSVLLIVNVFYYNKKNETCRFTRFKKYSHFPFVLGIFTGVNICPPFILAITKAFETQSIMMGFSFFIIFYIATSIFILPLIFSGFLKRMEAVKIVARITSVLAGIYLGIQGIGYLIN